MLCHHTGAVGAGAGGDVGGNEAVAVAVGFQLLHSNEDQQIPDSLETDAAVVADDENCQWSSLGSVVVLKTLRGCLECSDGCCSHSGSFSSCCSCCTEHCSSPCCRLVHWSGSVEAS